MKKLLLGLVAALALAVVGICVAASFQPDTYHVERSVTVAAAPADLFPYAGDYEKWPLWNPWREKDPAMKTNTSSPASGVGAWTSWEGNDQVGTGKMTILESVPDEKIVQKIEFFAPFEDSGTVTFAMVPEGETTKFTWAMDGNMPFVSKVMCLFFSMDAMLGADFEHGLEALRPLAEKDAATRKEAEAAAAAAAASQAADPAEAGVGAAP